jgi:acetyl-CoA synthetase
MKSPIIAKSTVQHGIMPHMLDYEKLSVEFSWQGVRRELQGLPGGRGLNIAHEAVDHHAETAGNRTAIRWIGADDTVLDISYATLRDQSNRFAALLESLGVHKGERIFSLTGRIPLLYVAVLGTLKHLNVFCPLFESFGPEPVLQRLSRGDGVILVTTRQHYQRKIATHRQQLPQLRHVLLVDAKEHQENNIWSLPLLLQQMSSAWQIPPTAPEDPALLHFTSGTTSMPKGALHVHEAVVSHYATGKYVLDFHPGDIFWCTADPGWVTGTSYSILAPLVHGITTVIDQAEFDARRWLHILSTQHVNILYTSPTAIRRLMRIEASVWSEYVFPHLRAIHSVGEPLEPQAVLWGERILNNPIHDNWWQTETGGIMIANFPGMQIKPGSMGRPIPGITATIIDPQNTEVPPGDIGMLALQSGWPSMFRNYIHDEERYKSCFSGKWYLTGDLASKDADGYFWFKGRADDIIKTAGHLVGPFEIEAVLVAHPAVAEAAVFGIPDPMLGEKVAACVVLHSGHNADDELQQEILGYSRKELGSAIAPRQIQFVMQLPKNRAGKIMRRLLKAQACDQPPGDISTLENIATSVNPKM